MGKLSEAQILAIKFLKQQGGWVTCAMFMQEGGNCSTLGALERMDIVELDYMQDPLYVGHCHALTTLYRLKDNSIKPKTLLVNKERVTEAMRFLESCLCFDDKDDVIGLAMAAHAIIQFEFSGFMPEDFDDIIESAKSIIALKTTTELNRIKPNKAV